jgi:hypothetical protein
MRIRTLVLLTVVSIPALAQAQYGPRPPRSYPPSPAYRGPAPQGPVFGLRLGYGAPFGELSDEGDPDLDDVVDHQIPIWIEMGYRFTPHLWGAIHGQIAPTMVNDSFCGGTDCDAMNYRIGVDLQLHLAPYQQVDPWVGIGFGYEWLNFEAFDDAGVFSDFSFSGWNLPLVEGGVDFALSPNVTIGPYVAWALGRYRHVEVDQPGLNISSDIDNEAYHSWFQIGVKGTFKL